MNNIVQAIISLRPNAKWTLNGDYYEGLVWKDTEQTKPTKEEVAAEAQRLDGLIQVQAQRSLEYPTIQEQLDTLYHGGLAEWKASIKAVKDKYPKP